MTKTEAQATDWDSRICVRCGQPPHLDEPCEPEGDERLGVDGWYGNEVSRITAEPPGWEGTRALHERHVAALRPTIAPQNLDLANAIYGYAVANASLFDQRQLAALHVVEDTLRGEYGVSR
jgi:hypothetical protein